MQMTYMVVILYYNFSVNRVKHMLVVAAADVYVQ